MFILVLVSVEGRLKVRIIQFLRRQRMPYWMLLNEIGNMEIAM